MDYVWGMRKSDVQYAQAKDHPCNLTKAQIDEYAAKCAQVLDFKRRDDLVALTERLGGRIRYVDLLDANLDGDTIWIHGPSDFDIELSSISSPLRDRFTIAHELGHYLLHSGQGERPLVAARHGSDRAEWEANWFAAGFLMPEIEFREEFRKTRSRAVLGAKFGVSEAAATVRAKVLGLGA